VPDAADELSNLSFNVFLFLNMEAKRPFVYVRCFDRVSSHY